MESSLSDDIKIALDALSMKGGWSETIKFEQQEVPESDSEENDSEEEEDDISEASTVERGVVEEGDNDEDISPYEDSASEFIHSTLKFGEKSNEEIYFEKEEGVGEEEMVVRGEEEEEEMVNSINIDEDESDESDDDGDLNYRVFQESVRCELIERR